MILGTDILLKLVREKNLVENLDEREINNPEGAGFDLRIGEIYLIEGDAFLGIEERKTPESKILAKYESGKRNFFTIKPGEFYLGKTIERLNIPENITVNFKPRTTTFRSGLIIRTGNVAPGYKGEIVFALKNESNCKIEIEMGARILHAQFYLIKGKVNLYRGQLQVGRVTASKLEKQI